MCADLLEASGYILHQVVGPSIIDGFSLDDLGSIWKFWGYMRGLVALEVLLFVFQGGKSRPWPSSFRTTPAERRAYVASCKLAVLTRCMRVQELSAADRGRLILLCMRLEQLDEVGHETCFKTGTISPVDLSSLLGSRVEDPDLMIPAYGSSASTRAILAAGLKGRDSSIPSEASGLALIPHIGR